MQLDLVNTLTKNTQYYNPQYSFEDFSCYDNFAAVISYAVERAASDQMSPYFVSAEWEDINIGPGSLSLTAVLKYRRKHIFFDPFKYTSLNSRFSSHVTQIVRDFYPENKYPGIQITIQSSADYKPTERRFYITIYLPPMMQGSY